LRYLGGSPEVNGGTARIGNLGFDSLCPIRKMTTFLLNPEADGTSAKIHQRQPTEAGSGDVSSLKIDV
jgi:hypothetical protein